jgi:hypothetical protein
MPMGREPSPSLIMQMFESNPVVANLVVIESVQRMAEFEHHVIRNIDDVADAGDAGSFQAVFQPFR